ncbi:MAG: hypothetical protein EZS28_013912 [Streblomastix strix]|uniref:GOLD domain-containing protein n=1 Tax=Streblomastix strix TaxID=222440 RepID=A0A5J4W799_9EUKA|nr:MAG: hypothetical protein EZS28_013912 [Streblomastix strix]
MRLLLLVLIFALPFTHAFLFDATRGDFNEFQEDYVPGEKISGRYDSISGFPSRIDFTILDPSKAIVYQQHRHDGFFNVTAEKFGTFTFQFHAMQAFRAQRISFILYEKGIEEKTRTGIKTDSEMDKSLTEVAKDMDHILTMQSSIRVKERKRREASSILRSRLVLWAVFQLVIVVGVFVYHARYFSKLFKKRRQGV